ncbi:MAG: carbon monoxide dehydrogenase [Betaproteobacteria bacterium RIFCSPLOWO2_12_FULL_63_13]|nr:MAG: carbon monoxide dehydrogenase [Betaproteobacteria bacterium RIFCSPLOWO2_12_FULL_63_13]
MTEFGIGKRVLRTEDHRFLTGRGQFVDDLGLREQTHAAVLRSPHAHALIRSIDTSRAAAAPGVLLVLTGADVAGDGLGGLRSRFAAEFVVGRPPFMTAQPLLVRDRVRHVGDRVALVVAETAAQAKDAAEMIDVDYEPLAPVIRMDDATGPDAPQLWDGAEGNVCVVQEIGDVRATDAAFAAAHHVERLKLKNQRMSANSMEPRGAIADYDPASRRYTLYGNTQVPHRLKHEIAQTVLHIPLSDLHVIARDVGGGFGMKGQLQPEDSLLVWAAGKLARPVRWIAERSEGLISDTHAREQMVEAELALDRDGRILALRARIDVNMGAYLATVATVALVPGTQTMVMLSGMYRIPLIHAVTRSVFTNTTPVGTYRGAGRPQGTYIIERLIDAAARSMGLDQVEIRRRNFIPSAALPYATPLTMTYDSGDFEAIMDAALKTADWSGFEERRRTSKARGKLRGIGICTYIEVSAHFNERMEIRVDADGAAMIIAGTFSHGQGHETVFAQLVNEWLGIPFEKIRLIQGDTDTVLFGRGTFAARSATAGGGALRFAADEVIKKGKRFAAHMIEVAEADIEFSEGRFRLAGTDRSVELVDVARIAHAPFGVPQDLGVGWSGTGVYDPSRNFPNGCHVCEVEIDAETGAVAVVAYVCVDDVGTVLNPLIVEGQTHGAIVAGLGQSLMEEVVYDPGSGQQLSGSFMDYCMPRADDFPDFNIAFRPVPTTTNPLGVKGAGEAGTIAATPAAIHAILDALAAIGVRHIDMPATPEAVWRAIRSTGGRGRHIAKLSAQSAA